MASMTSSAARQSARAPATLTVLRCAPQAQRCSLVTQALSRRALLSSATVAAAAVATALPSLARENLTESFIADTRVLSEAMSKYMTLDPYDKERITSYGVVKTEGKKWIAAHARGGSAPGAAAKRMYVAVDAVTGHITANGAAPLPANKIRFVTKTLQEVDTLMAENK